MDSNEMFILALVAISIVGVVCLGLLVVLAILILHKKRIMGQQGYLPATVISPVDSPSSFQKKSHLTIGDWVTYLTSEKYGSISTVINFGAILLLFAGAIMSIQTGTWYQHLGNGIVVFSLALFVFNKFFKPIGRRGDLSNKILNNIMTGKLTNEEDIRKEWIEGLKQKKKGRKTSDSKNTTE